MPIIQCELIVEINWLSDCFMEPGLKNLESHYICSKQTRNTDGDVLLILAVKV